ncbi:MAG: flagellar protein FlaG [Syntrophomonas sp.]
MRVDGQATAIEFLSASALGQGPKSENGQDQVRVEDARTPEAGLTPVLKDVQNAVKFSNDVMRLANYHIEFKIQESTNKYQVQVVDNESGGIIREIPSDYMMKIAEQLEGKIQAEAGLLIDKIA